MAFTRSAVRSRSAPPTKIKSALSFSFGALVDVHDNDVHDNGAAGERGARRRRFAFRYSTHTAPVTPRRTHWSGHRRVHSCAHVPRPLLLLIRGRLPDLTRPARSSRQLPPLPISIDAFVAPPKTSPQHQPYTNRAPAPQMQRGDAQGAARRSRATPLVSTCACRRYRRRGTHRSEWHACGLRRLGRRSSE